MSTIAIFLLFCNNLKILAKLQAEAPLCLKSQPCVSEKWGSDLALPIFSSAVAAGMRCGLIAACSQFRTSSHVDAERPPRFSRRADLSGP